MFQWPKPLRCHRYSSFYKCRFCGYSTNVYSSCYRHMGVHEVLVSKMNCKTLGEKAGLDFCREVATPKGSDIPMKSSIGISNKSGVNFLTTKFKTKSKPVKSVKPPPTTSIASPSPTTPNLLKCPHCPLVATNAYNLNKHIKSHNYDATHKCDLCVYSTNKRNRLEAHVSLHTDGCKEKEMVRCPHCPMVTSEFRLRSHLRNHSYNLPYKCKFCSYSTNSPASCYRHSKVHEEARMGGEAVCGVVGRERCRDVAAPRFLGIPGECADLRDGNLDGRGVNGVNFLPIKSKLNLQNKSKPVKKLISSPSMSSLGFASATSKSKCPHCPLVTNLFRLKKHLQFHSSRFPHKCQFCTYSTKNSSLLCNHTKVHSEGYKATSMFKCPHCPLITYAEGLKKHLLFHNSSYSFKCELCSYSTKGSSSLASHMQLHGRSFKATKNPSQSLVKCAHCPLETTEFNLQKHLRYHNYDSPYKCRYCTYSTDVYNSCYRHMKKVHKEAVEDAGEDRYCDAVPFRSWEVPVESSGFSGGISYDRGDDGVDILPVKKKVKLQNKPVEELKSSPNKPKPVEELKSSPSTSSVASASLQNKPKPVEESKSPPKLSIGSASPTPKSRCPYCPLVTDTYRLKKHLQFHSSDFYYKCDFCSFSTKSCSALSYHKKLHGEGHKAPENQNVVQCPYCPLETSVVMLERHLQYHNYDAIYKCKSCRYSTDSLTSCYNHTKVHKKAAASVDCDTPSECAPPTLECTADAPPTFEALDQKPDPLALDAEYNETIGAVTSAPDDRVPLAFFKHLEEFASMVQLPFVSFGHQTLAEDVKGDMEALRFQGDRGALKFKGDMEALRFKGDMEALRFKGDMEALRFQCPVCSYSCSEEGLFVEHLGEHFCLTGHPENRRGVDEKWMVELKKKMADLIWKGLEKNKAFENAKESCVDNEETYLDNNETCRTNKESHVVDMETCIVKTESCVDNEETYLDNRETCITNKESHVVDTETCIVKTEPCVDNEETYLDNKETSIFNNDTHIADMEACIIKKETI